MDSINRFFDVIHSDSSVEERIGLLIQSLDLVAVHCHQIEFTFDDADYPEPPESTSESRYTSTYQMIGKQFPCLGYYNVASSVHENFGHCEVSVGDAIDDITDIYNDLKDVLWYFENTSDDNALFYFDLGYRTHWGRHLRSLQFCLHEFMRR